MFGVIKIINIDHCIKIFNEYCDKYDMNNPKIKQRYNHTFRVMKISHNIASSLNLSNEEILLSELIGLLHDIGRFYQITTYENISDKKTIDHADYGCEILFNDNLIEKLNIDNKYYEIIKKSIRNHNKVTLENNMNDKELLFSKIIRDADKLDILYLIGNEDELPKKIEDVTNTCKNYFLEGKIIPYHCIESSGDKVLIYLCYIYDINYKYSFNHIKENSLYEDIYNKLDNKHLFDKYFTNVYQYVNERI